MKHMRLSNNAVLQKSKQVRWKDVDGQAVLLHFQSGDYFTLNPMGTFLWSTICTEPKKMEDLLELVSSEYNCGKEQALQDIKDICGQLLAEKLLEVKE